MSLRWCLRHQRTTITVLLITIAFNVYLYTIVPKGFFPQQDTGRMTGSVQAAQDISFPAMNTKVQQFFKIVKDDPAVDTVSGSVGGNGGYGGSVNTARSFIQLKPLEVRKLTVDEVVARLRPKLSKVPGATLFMQPVQDIKIGAAVATRSTNTRFRRTHWRN